MADYDNTNRGVAFLNDKKGNTQAPDYKGTGNYDGVDFEFSIWNKKARDGKEFMSFSFQEKYEKKTATQPQTGDKNGNGLPVGDINDNLPF